MYDKLIQTNIQLTFSTGDKSFLNEMKFCEISRKTELSNVHLDKQKIFIHKKYEVLPLFSANKWHLDVLTFLIKGFVYDNSKVLLV